MRNRALRGCLIATVLAVTAITVVHSKEVRGHPTQKITEQQNNPPEKEPPPNPDKRGTAELPLIVRPLAAEKTQQEAEEDTRDRRDKHWYEGATLVIGVATLLILIVQAIAFFVQAIRLQQTIEAMKKIGADQSRDMQSSIAIADKAAKAANQSAEVAERALIAANRPWVKVDIHVGGPIFYNVNGANFRLNYVLKNVGKSPATNVWINAQIFAPAIGLDDHLDLRAKQLEIIFGLKTRLPSPFGFALFPGDVISQGIIVSIPADELKRITQNAEFIAPTIIGAIDYRSSFSQSSHQTGFIVEVRRSDKPRPISTEKKRHPPAIFPDEGDIPAAEIRLFRSFLEGGYAD
jgi:hypothetical protein